MKCSNAKIIFVTDSNSQSRLFIEHIEARLKCEISLRSPDDSIEAIKTNNALILLDAAEMDDSRMQNWYVAAAGKQGLVLAAINLRDENHATQVLACLYLKGVFYRRDSIDLICKGISKLLDDNLWMSRSLMTQLIERYRNQQLNAYRPVGGLTQRELEIICLLGSGASNNAIARQLFVSEHTVKSHLYNIFRKLDVRNRIQATNWARQNLGVLPNISASAARKPAETRSAKNGLAGTDAPGL
ncbi:LuxR C-terminal-related transcriptional regulator [uncultured Salinisphaera sp.]|uniref:LuxR C-terminal-related transcriptional regulator n=1 Tax=uncultured Salinisphaera sp. TaxID=359372 RepID=UPI0032B1C7F3|tara:strand:+ start:771 stop:1499 length:729 start_codon:yes stop_codon:yes gene_type:complete